MTKRQQNFPSPAFPNIISEEQFDIIAESQSRIRQQQKYVSQHYLRTCSLFHHYLCSSCHRHEYDQYRGANRKADKQKYRHDQIQRNNHKNYCEYQQTLKKSFSVHFDRATMIFVPFFAAEIAKLMSASTGHMIASLGSLQNHFTIPALSELIIVLNIYHPVFVAVPFMVLIQAYCTKSGLAYGTEGFFFSDCYESVALLCWTQPYCSIFGDVLKDHYLVIFVLQTVWQGLYVLGSCFKSVIAVLSETFNELESLDLMLDVSVETCLAEAMTALIEDFNLFLIFLDAANLANLHIGIHDGIRLFDSLQRLFLSDILWRLK